MIKHKQTVTVFLSLLLLIFLPIVSYAAEEKEDFFAKRREQTLALPHESEITFLHKQTSSGHSILESHTFSFRAERDSVVSILFSNGATLVDGGESYNTITASVYSDEGKKICEEQTDISSDTAHIEFVSAYGGVYFLVLESRATAAGDYPCSFSVCSASDYEKNTIDTFPHMEEYIEGSHKSLSFSKLFLNTKYGFADKYKVSVFEFSHEAGSVFSYKLSVPDTALSPYAVIMTFDGDVYTPHISHEGEGYSCGDAIELSYSAKSYLFIFSDGSFSLEADMLLHNEYKIKDMGQAFSGKLDTSDAPLMYDQEKIDAIAKAFPFSEIKNRNIIFFSFQSTQSSVVSYLCDRGEHKFLTLVSDEMGLSHSSSYPMRKFGEYCSEISPCEYCYSSYINDGTKFYLCYTGTAISTYAQVQSTPTHTTSFVPEQKYKPEDILPRITVQNIYSDSDIYINLGIEKSSPDLMKISGYMLEDENGCRYYFSYDEDITVPDVDGKIKLYATVDCIYNSNNASKSTTVEHHSFLVCELYCDRGFLAPIIEDVAEYFEGNLWLIFIIVALSASGIGTGAFFAVKHIRKKKLAIQNSEADCTDTANTSEQENAKEAGVGQDNGTV